MQNCYNGGQRIQKFHRQNDRQCQCGNSGWNAQLAATIRRGNDRRGH